MSHGLCKLFLLVSLKELSESHETFNVLHDAATFPFFEVEKKPHQIQANQKQQKFEATLENGNVVRFKIQLWHASAPCNGNEVTPPCSAQRQKDD